MYKKYIYGKNLYKPNGKGIKVYMERNAMKNMIILRDLPSNMVEEAYIVFKNNAKIHKVQKIEKRKIDAKEEKAKTTDYMVKEAEMIVSDYIARIEKREYELGNGNQKLKEKYKRLKAITIFLGMFSCLSLALILLR